MENELDALAYFGGREAVQRRGCEQAKEQLQKLSHDEYQQIQENIRFIHRQGICSEVPEDLIDRILHDDYSVISKMAVDYLQAVPSLFISSGRILGKANIPERDKAKLLALTEQCYEIPIGNDHIVIYGEEARIEIYLIYTALHQLRE